MASGSTRKTRLAEPVKGKRLVTDMDQPPTKPPPPGRWPARGPGHGGPAKGAHVGAPSYTPEELARYRHPGGAESKIKAVPGVKGFVSLDPKSPEAEEHARRMLATVINVADTTDFELARLDAASKAMDRIWGKPKQSTEISGKDGGPLEMLGMIEAAHKKKNDQ